MEPIPNCIFLSRHGESEYMMSDLIGGDSPLTAYGRTYSECLTHILLPLLVEAPLVFTSTLQRTIQTAAHLPFPQQRLAALDEINAGICEHMTYAQVQQCYPAVHEARSADKLGYRYPRGESYLDLVARLWPVVHQLEHRSSPVVIVAHQAVLRVLVGLLLRKPLQEMPGLSIPLHTVMQLTPTAAGGYDMDLFKAALPALTAQQPAAAAAVATQPATSKKIEHCKTDSASSRSSSDTTCADEDLAHVTGHTWPTQHWAGSCTSGAQVVQAAAAAVLAEQTA